MAISSRGQGTLRGGDVDVGVGEGAEEGRDVLGEKHGLVGLDVDVDFEVVPGGGVGYGVDAVGAGGEGGVGEEVGPGVGAAEGGDVFGVGGDDDGGELRAGACGGVDPG